uniref:LuxR C-terminal-related transcriptional regulator n=1 Tax=uncultured Sphingomonas sp. TaxID=158754 RepID=UPI0035CAD427
MIGTASNGFAGETHQSEDDTPPIRVLIVDPRDFDRECTLAGLQSAKGLEVTASPDVDDPPIASDLDLILFQTARPIFADGQLLQELADARKRWPGARKLVIGEVSGEQDLAQLIAAGSQGLLTPDANLETVRCAILLLMSDFSVYPRNLMAHLQALAQIETSRVASKIQLLSHPSRRKVLTRRQQDVLQLLVTGLSNKIIAQRLRISESTVKVHIRKIMARNGASNRTQIVADFLQAKDEED